MRADIPIALASAVSVTSSSYTYPLEKKRVVLACQYDTYFEQPAGKPKSCKKYSHKFKLVRSEHEGAEYYLRTYSTDEIVLMTRQLTGDCEIYGSIIKINRKDWTVEEHLDGNPFVNGPETSVATGTCTPGKAY